jgi:nicotinamide phosphoribosyltransferase
MKTLFAPFNADGYKPAHAQMYSDGTELIYNNLTPRSDSIYRNKATRYYDGKVVVIGIQGAWMEVVESWQEFFDMNKEDGVALFKMLCDNYFGPDVIGTEGLSKLHDLGYLPLEVKSLPEGSLIEVGTPVLTVRNTVPHAFWLVNFLETVISSLTWKMMTNATIAREYKAMLTDFAKRTASPLEGVLYQGHDFSARGMSGPEDAARSGFAHLPFFMGTDSLGSILYAMNYYGASGTVGSSVPATEHSVTTSNILRIEQGYKCRVPEHSKLEAEYRFTLDLITRKFPTGTIACVFDSFDFWAVLTQMLPQLKDVIMARQSNGVTPGKLVVRPDSGNPVEVVCGTAIYLDVPDDQGEMEWAVIQHMATRTELFPIGEGHELTIQNNEGKFMTFQVGGYAPDEDDEKAEIYYEIHNAWYVEATPEMKGAIQVLWEIFGGTVTLRGYRLLDEHIGLIYGDSITPQRCLEILERLAAKRFASGNVVFGIGSYTYQHNTRDTFGFAVKATMTEVKDKQIAVYKEPKTDSRKNSDKGLLFVGKKDGGFFKRDNVSQEDEASEDNMLKTILLNGTFVRRTTLDELRNCLSV